MGFSIMEHLAIQRFILRAYSECAIDLAMMEKLNILADDVFFAKKGTRHEASLQDQYHDWLYENYSINNGDMLIALLERSDTLPKFLHDMGLPEDTEIE